MKILFPALLVVPLIIGCAGSGSLRPPSDPLERLKYDLNAVLSDSLFVPARTSIKVVSLKSNEVLFEKDSKQLMRPASNMKLLTSATALKVLGKDYRFGTSVYADSVTPAGVVLGNLYVKGFGDPDLKTEDLDSLASVVRASGVTTVLGNIVSDVSAFDDLYWGNGWMWDDEPSPDEMYISALSVNKNSVKILVQPADSAGFPAKVSIDPPTSYVSLVNAARTVKDTVINRLNVSRRFKERLNTITVEGEILADTSAKREISLSVWRPELYAAQLFQESLGKSGISVLGHPSLGPASVSAQVRAQHFQRIDSMVINLNKVSDNLAAENTLKVISMVRFGPPGTAESGVYVVNEFLSSMGIDTTKFLMVDGSGVSHYNLLTTEMLTQLLVGMYRLNDIFPLYYASLPIAGVDGTLKNRMKATLAEGNLRGKTGTISGVSSLSGYVTTQDGELLAFSMMMQNFIISSNAYRMTQDRIGQLLAGFSRKGRASTLLP